MPVKIRLMRLGSKKRPFYRVVAINEQKQRNGKYLELLGTYNPLVEPKEILLNQALIDKWVKQGAVMSTGFLRIIGKAPQKPPRKPKKAVEEKPQPKEAAPQEAPATEETTLETSSESTSQEETAAEAQDEETTPAAVEPAAEPEPTEQSS